MVNDSWDSVIEYTRDHIERENLDWVPVQEFKNSTKTALLSNIVGQYMADLEHKEEETGEPAPPDLKAFTESFGKYYNIAITQVQKDLGIIETDTAIHLPAVRPTEHILTQDKISNKGFSGIFANKIQYALAMEKKGSSIQVNTYVTVNYEGLDRTKVQGVKWLTLYDREVLDAVHTLFKAGNAFVTIDQINRVMNGKSDETRATAKQAKRIDNSLTKLMYTQITIDATEEARAFGWATEYGYDNPVIIGRRGWATVNGNKVKGVFIYDLGLLNYAEIKNQIARVPLEVKDTPINKNENATVLQGYLLRRVSQIKSGVGNRISLDSLLTELGIIDLSKSKLTSADANKRKTTIDQIKAILDYWSKPDIAFIKGYKVLGKRPVKGFEIIY